MNVGIIGTGNIAPAYMRGCGLFADVIKVVACADLDIERAQAFAAAHDLKAMSVVDLLADGGIDIVLNLTIPSAHTEVSLAIIAAGKHVYSEKPLALNRDEGRAILDAAAAAGLRVGCAPDTFLGAGGQSSRAAIEAIGQPVAAVANMACHGHEGWHPNPAFYYQPGGGPLFDMGPYYLTALVNLLGPMQTVSALSSRAFGERVARKRDDEVIAVEVDTHIAGLIGFANGAVATIIMSFDVWRHHLPIIEIYGTLGSMTVPDPNRFDGEATVWHTAQDHWGAAPTVGRADVQRGLGVADMARAIADGTPHRASGELAYHVLDAMQALLESAQNGERITLTSTVAQPAPLL